METSTKSRLPGLGVFLLLLGCIAYGFGLDRYPGLYIDDAFFTYPAMKAYLGGPFTYIVSQAAPFNDQVWAYHSPILPHLLELLFKLFGYHPVLARLPDFLGAWTAALLIVLFLNRRGYRFAGVAFAILWCGDRVTQESMYGRMEGLALLSLVVSFLCLRRAWETRALLPTFLCGFFCGFSALIHPLCFAYAGLAFLFVAYRARVRGILWFALGGVLNVLILLLFWGRHLSESTAQFLWHAHIPRGDTALSAFATTLHTMRWSHFWFAALVLFAMVCAVLALRMLTREKPELDPRTLDFVLAAGFGLAALQVLFHNTLMPYYVVYFSAWPMLCLVILSETYWKRMRPVALVMVLIWTSSLAWNVLRVRESILYHKALSRDFLYATINDKVPHDAPLLVTPELYAFPLAAGHRNFQLPTFQVEHQDICAECFVFMQQKEYERAEYLIPANLAPRKVLYAGPAFPGAGPLITPIVILSPEAR